MFPLFGLRPIRRTQGFGANQQVANSLQVAHNGVGLDVNTIGSDAIFSGATLDSFASGWQGAFWSSSKHNVIRWFLRTKKFTVRSQRGAGALPDQIIEPNKKNRYLIDFNSTGTSGTYIVRQVELPNYLVAPSRNLYFTYIGWNAFSSHINEGNRRGRIMSTLGTPTTLSSLYNFVYDANLPRTVLTNSDGSNFYVPIFYARGGTVSSTTGSLAVAKTLDWQDNLIPFSTPLVDTVSPPFYNYGWGVADTLVTTIIIKDIDGNTLDTKYLYGSSNLLDSSWVENYRTHITQLEIQPLEEFTESELTVQSILGF